MAAEYLSKSFHAGSGLIASIVALYACVMLIEVIRRIRLAERDLAIGWTLHGALSIGSGLWAAHFLGLFSLDLPIEVGYDKTLTVLSWLPSVLSIAVILSFMGRPHLPAHWRIVGGLVWAVGVSLTLYLGIASMGIHTGIDWDARILLVVGLPALAVMALGSVMIRRTLDGGVPITAARRLLLATPCAIGVRGVQYAALASANFPFEAQSLSSGQLSGDAMVGLVTGAIVLLFVSTQMAILLDQRMRQQHDRLTHTLQDAHHELQDSAHRDTLTRLLNRQGVERHLHQLLSAASSMPHDLVLMFINLDGFKMVNQSLGHGQGDALLKQAAQRLGDLIRRDDLVARVAADEFVMLFQGQIDRGNASNLARRVDQALSLPFLLDKHEITLSSSIGIMLHPPTGTSSPELAPGDVPLDACTLIRRAETAMRHAKAAGGGVQCFYEAGMTTSNTEELDLQRDLRQAIDRHELMLFYQPKRHARSGQCSGAEALLRWKHGTRGMISPGVFIPLAERFGLISTLGAWVITEACRQIRAWQDEGIELQVAVNLSVHQLRQPDLADRIRDTIEQHGIEARLLIFEITESVAMDNVQASLKVFERLAAIGVQLSIDDFGTGYSSLSYLSKLPASQLKIDRSFVMELEDSHHAQAIVEAVVRLAHALRLKVVAEGVETETQHQALLALGCDELQGFLFARPMPPEELSILLHPQPQPSAVRPVQARNSDSDFAVLH